MKLAHFFWSGVRNWGTRLGSVVLFLIVARILSGHELGLFSAAIAILAIAELFADNGIGDAVVQARKLNPGALSAAFLVNLGAGIILGILLFIFAERLEIWFGADGLAPMLRVLSLSLILNAASYIAQSIFRREMAFRWLAVRALIATFISGAIGVTMALMGYGAWSLVAQAIILATINCALIWWRAPFNPLVRPDFGAAKGLLRFGLSLLTGRVLYYIGTRAIELVLLYRHSATILSYYVIGSRLYFVLAQMIMAVLIDVSFATLSRIADDRVALQNAFLPMIRTASIVAVPIFLGLAAVAPEACVVAFGDKGEEAAVYLQIVALFGALQVTQHFLSSMLGVVGRPGVATAILAVRAALVALVVLPGWALDPVQLVLLSTATLLITLPCDFYACRRVASLGTMAILKAIAPAYLAGGAMLLAVLAARWALAGQVPDVFLRLAVLAGIGALTYAVLLLLFAPKLVRSQLQAIRARIRGKARAAG